MKENGQNRSTKAVVRMCRKRGLVVDAVEQVGAVLTLRPRSTATLPSARVLQELADELRGGRVRYVALDLEEGSDHG